MFGKLFSTASAIFARFARAGGAQLRDKGSAPTATATDRRAAFGVPVVPRSAAERRASAKVLSPTEAQPDYSVFAQ